MDPNKVKRLLLSCVSEIDEYQIERGCQIHPFPILLARLERALIELEEKGQGE